MVIPLALCVVLRKLVLIEMSHILRARFPHYIVKADTQIKKNVLGENYQAMYT